MIALKIALIAYVGMFFLVFGFNVAIGPITPALAFVRGLVWPVYLTTGWPQGRTLPMD